jgi:hypothetical protein
MLRPMDIEPERSLHESDELRIHVSRIVSECLDQVQDDLADSFARAEATLEERLQEVSGGTQVFDVDLSQVVSKWICETEENLRRLFDRAEENGVVLLLDEADALFGKRAEPRLCGQHVPGDPNRVSTRAGS